LWYRTTNLTGDTPVCNCGKPTVNGQHGYKWQASDRENTYPIDPPKMADGDRLLFDENGRCGEVDSHCYHFRVVREEGGRVVLLVRHGRGDERVNLSSTTSFLETLSTLDTDARYWLLSVLYHSNARGRRDATRETNHKWYQAAAEKRIKTRKSRGADSVKVWIEDRVAV
jgi:hypothetical protein